MSFLSRRLFLSGSSAGVTWNQSTLPQVANWRDVAFGNGKFIAISYYGSSLPYSSDGINWTDSAIGALGWTCIATAPPTKAVIFAENTNVPYYSNDSINWTAGSNTSQSIGWSCVAYGDSKFVAMVKGSNITAISVNGANWAQQTITITKDWVDIAYGNGIFVAIAYNTIGAAYSSDRVSWNTCSLPVSTSWTSLAFGNGIFVAVAESGYAAYSSDGINWTESSLPFTGTKSIAYGNGKFVAISATLAQSAYSSDGINWTEVTTPYSADAITYGGERFVAVRSGTNQALYTNIIL